MALHVGTVVWHVQWWKESLQTAGVGTWWGGYGLFVSTQNFRNLYSVENRVF